MSWKDMGVSRAIDLANDFLILGHTKSAPNTTTPIAFFWKKAMVYSR